MTARAPSATGERERLILEYMPFVRALARRYADRGEPLEDLEQVGLVGLINAVDRYDAARGHDFRSFAAPTIVGENRRHFRDRTWAVRVPRSVKEDQERVTATVEQLSTQRGRTPNVREIAEEGGLSTDRVLDALAAQSAYRPRSLSRVTSDGDGDGELDVEVAEDGFELAEDRVVLRECLETLPARERMIIHLRFDRGLLQSQIAATLGISQMHVSRLIARALDRLRAAADG